MNGKVCFNQLLSLKKLNVGTGWLILIFLEYRISILMRLDIVVLLGMRARCLELAFILEMMD
jgi:hypothetical protein